MKKNKKGPVVLCVLDGWGEANEIRGNAILKANLPTIKKIDKFYPKLYLQASGIAVGLPWGVSGNSEVGHQSMGTGQIIYQKLPIINTSIQDGSFFENETLKKSVQYAKKNNSKIHLLGLTSDGGVHSHIEHLFALLEMMKKNNIEKDVYIHAITDGRDTPPKSAEDFISDLTNKIKEIGIGKIATVSGRYYSMDRSENWDRTEKAFRAMVYGDGLKASNPLKAIQNQYKKRKTDEFIEPTVIENTDKKPIAKIESKDVLIFFNFRKDRAKQIARAFAEKDFDNFSKTKIIKKINAICFTRYEKKLNAEIVFHPQEISFRVGEKIEEAGLSQTRIAETEKFAHVTYFFDGGKVIDFKKENKIHILSKKVSSYAELPEMSSREITSKLIQELGKKDPPDFILINYASPDMVGHTGNLEAGIKAVEFIDKCLAEVINKITEVNGTLLLTADHGNVEEMIDLSTGEKSTEHSNNPVPCWLITPESYKKTADTQSVADQSFEVEGFLSDLAPTILDLLDIEKPKKMTGDSLIPIFRS